MIKSKFLFPLLFLTMVSLNGCISLSGLHTGKTVPKGKSEVSASVNFNTSPNFQDDDDDDFDVIPVIPLAPSVELGFRHGISERFDIGFKANSFLNFLLDGKVQLVGDQDSRFAVATGLGIGMFGLSIGDGLLYNVQVPFYTSFHPSENFTIALAPKYIGQFRSGGNGDFFLNYIGANLGFIWGNTRKFGIDLGLYRLTSGVNVGDSDGGISLFNLGIGTSFQF